MAEDNTKIKELKRENDHDDLKTKISELQNELKVIKKKLETGTTDDELRNSANFVSAEYDEFRATKSQIQSDFKKFDGNLTEIAKKVYDINESIESTMAYSRLGFHSIPRETKDNRHSRHVGAPNKRNNQNSFVKSTPTWPP